MTLASLFPRCHPDGLLPGAHYGSYPIQLPLDRPADAAMPPCAARAADAAAGGGAAETLPGVEGTLVRRFLFFLPFFFRGGGARLPLAFYLLPLLRPRSAKEGGSGRGAAAARWPVALPSSTKPEVYKETKREAAAKAAAAAAKAGAAFYRCSGTGLLCVAARARSIDRLFERKRGEEGEKRKSTFLTLDRRAFSKRKASRAALLP